MSFYRGDCSPTGGLHVLLPPEIFVELLLGKLLEHELFFDQVSSHLSSSLDLPVDVVKGHFVVLEEDLEQALGFEPVVEYLQEHLDLSLLWILFYFNSDFI